MEANLNEIQDAFQDEDNSAYYHHRSLHDYWYPVTFATEIKPNLPYSVSLFGIPLVIFRGKAGLVCLEDRCSHRSTPLSIGAVENGEIECRYHGWKFSTDGECTRVPSFEPNQKIPSNFSVPHFPVREYDGIVWIWLGDKSKIDDLFFTLSKEDAAGLEIVQAYWDLNYSADITMENALDPSHLQFAHAGQQGKNVGPRSGTYPGAAGTYSKVEKINGGFKGRISDPNTKQKMDYEIHLYYPYFTAALINDGSTRIRICTWVVPLSKNKSRLLFRFYRSFVKWLPASMFASTNNIIAAQDRVVLVGQQMRMEEGSPGWNIRVKSDSLAYEYRKWWDRVAQTQKLWFKNWEPTRSCPSLTLAALPDIEDMGRSTIHPCVDRHIEVQEEYADKVIKLFPKLWPEQYKSSNYTRYAIIATSAIALAVGYFAGKY
jgi:vanillate O-demethylase monooxygenase subunit